MEKITSVKIFSLSCPHALMSFIFSSKDYHRGWHCHPTVNTNRLSRAILSMRSAACDSLSIETNFAICTCCPGNAAQQFLFEYSQSGPLCGIFPKWMILFNRIAMWRRGAPRLMILILPILPKYEVTRMFSREGKLSLWSRSWRSSVTSRSSWPENSLEP